ncbi:MAG: hypothetical protein GY698_05515 [Actinomycetia bacterium]|nr:hypothetical protein [Actinomycetes bacterium]
MVVSSEPSGPRVEFEIGEARTSDQGDIRRHCADLLDQIGDLERLLEGGVDTSDGHQRFLVAWLERSERIAIHEPSATDRLNGAEVRKGASVVPDTDDQPWVITQLKYGKRPAPEEWPTLPVEILVSAAVEELRR